MSLEKIQFTNQASKRVYEDYLKRIQRTIKSLSKNDRNEILMEINSHIYEGFQQNKGNDEIDRLLDVLEKLGSPEEVLKPLVADKKMEQATRTFNPFHIAKALLLNITNGVSYIIFFALYLMLFGFVFLIFSEIVNPSGTGLFFDGNSFQALGKINPEYLEGSTIHEVLGYWFIPAMILAILISYFLITLLMKFKRKINHK